MEKTKRTLSIGEAMILICSTALGLALMRFYLAGVNSAFGEIADTENQVARMRFTGSAICILTFWSLALLILNVRRSSQRDGSDLAAPGVAACVSIAIVLLFEFIYGIRVIYVCLLVKSGLLLNVEDWGAPVAAAISGSWITLLIGGRWKVCSSWLDWSSRLIAACWIIVAILDAILKAFL
jgi:hypothetical protein